MAVVSVRRDRNAGQAGLRAGDTIVSWNGAAAPRRPQHWVIDQNPGDLLKLRIRREERESTIEFRLGEIRQTVYHVSEDARANEKTRRLREGLLRSETSKAGAN